MWQSSDEEHVKVHKIVKVSFLIGCWSCWNQLSIRNTSITTSTQAAKAWQLLFWTHKHTCTHTHGWKTLITEENLWKKSHIRDTQTTQMQEIWKMKHKMPNWTRVPCENTACAHTHVCARSPQRQHSCADAVEFEACLYFLYLTDNSRVTPTVPFICFHDTLQTWSERTEEPLQLCSSGKPLPFSSLKTLIKLQWSCHILHSLLFLETTTVSWHALIPTQPCDEVMCWTQWPESWFSLAFWNVICVFICFIPKHSD